MNEKVIYNKKYVCLKGVYAKIYGIAMLYCVWNIQFDFYQKICLHNDIRSSEPPTP